MQLWAGVFKVLNKGSPFNNILFDMKLKHYA